MTLKFEFASPGKIRESVVRRRLRAGRLRRVGSIALLAALFFAASGTADHVLHKLSDGFEPTFSLTSGTFASSPDGEWVVFDACDAGSDDCLIASVRRNVGATSSATALSPLYVDAGSLYSLVSADSRHVVYYAPTATSGDTEAWSVPVDGSAAPVRLHPALAGDEYLDVFELAADGQVAIIAIRNGGGGGTLYRAPVDGSSAATPIDAGETDEISTYTAPGGAQYALYFIDGDNDGRFEIRKVNLAGGAPLPLGPAELRQGAEIQSVRIAPDGSRAVIQVDNVVAGRFELVGLSLSGPAALDQLSQTPVAEGDVTRVQISDDSEFAVFRADAVVDGKAELWSVPIDGSAAPIALSGTLGADRDVTSFELAGSWAVFLADASVDEKVELWSAPIDGGAARTRRSATLPAGRDVFDFKIAPNGTRLIYRANPAAETQHDLYSTTVFGLTQHIQLTNLPGGFPAIYSPVVYHVSPDSRRLAFDIAPGGGFNAALFEQSLILPAPIPAILAVAESTPWLFDDIGYLPDSAGLIFRGALEIGSRVEVFLADERCFADGFEAGNSLQWSATVP